MVDGEEEEEEEEVEEGEGGGKRKRKMKKRDVLASLSLLEEEDEEDEDGREEGVGGGMRRRRLGGKEGGREGQVRHGLLKGPRCAVCQQYCFLEQVHCSSCSSTSSYLPSSSSITVCGDHALQACASGTCPAAALVYRQRCPPSLLASLVARL